MTRTRLGRRAFTLGAAGVFVAGCGEEDTAPGPRARLPTTQRVAVIGAGIAGLHCAYCLDLQDVEVQVYEALGRVGGRVLTARNVFPPVKSSSSTPKVAGCELGAEFIGTYDAAMRWLARELGIELQDASTVPAAFKGRRYVIAGKEVEEQEIVTRLADATTLIVSALQSEDTYKLTDNTSLATWFAEKLPAEQYGDLGTVLSSAFRSEFGLDPDQLSALNLLALIGGESGGPFHFFKRREQRFRTAERNSEGRLEPGMDQFPVKLAQRLQDRIHLENRLHSVSRRGGGYSLVFERANGEGFETEAEHVVFAIPFSTLKDVDLSALNLSSQKRRMIADLGYGTTAKLAALFDSRTWRERTSTGAGLDESREFWDGALRGDPDYGVLSAVLGGTPGLSSNASDADQTFLMAMPELELLFREIETKYRPGSAVRVHWASLPSFKGSASCYLPGQWAWRGTEARREGGLHFCGEHCSIDFQGRLEGAAETGALVAAEILEDLGQKLVSEYHSAIVLLKRSVPQPYQMPDTSVLGLQARVQEVTDTHVKFVENLGVVPGG